MTKQLRLGLVGADATGKGWAPLAHIPAIRGLDEIELSAVCTTSPESAAAAARAYGVERAFHDVGQMAATPKIDAVAVVVRAVHHHEAVLAALKAGKHVYCEWPLGTSIQQTEELAAVARQQGVVTAVGLQGRHTPALQYLKELVDEGWLGELLSVDVSAVVSGTTEAASQEVWERERNKGAHLFNVTGGHTVDTLLFCCGALSRVSARVTTRIRRVRFADTGVAVDVEKPDTVLFVGELGNGAAVSYRAATVTTRPAGWRMELNGSKGTLVATTPALPQITPVELRCARGSEELEVLAVPERLNLISGNIAGPARNVAGIYRGFAKAIETGGRFTPDFDHALVVHRILESLVQSSREGRAVMLDSSGAAENRGKTS
jgi:predicted dehydrogenase